MNSRALFFYLLTLLLPPGLGAANIPLEIDRETESWSTEAGTRIKELSSMTEAWGNTPPDEATLLKAQKEVSSIRDRAEQCITDFSAQVASVQELIAALGEPDASAADDIREARKRFESTQQAVDRQLAVCRLLAIEGRDIRERINEQRRALLSRQMLRRYDNIWRVLSDFIVNGAPHEAEEALKFEPWPASAFGLLILALLLPVTILFGTSLREHFAVPAKGEMAPMRRHTVLAAMYSRRAPWMAGMLAAIATLYFAGAAPLAAVGAALLLSTLVAPLVHLSVCRGRLRCAQGVPARVLVDLVLIAGALVLIGGDQYVAHEIFLLLRAAFLLLLALVALWLLHKLSQRKDLETLRGLRLPIALALLAGPVADWLGYRDLGSFLSLGISGSGAGILLTWLLLSSLGQVFDQLRDSEQQDQPGLRQWLGYGQGERVPGLGIMSWLIRIAALLGLGYWLLFSWQVSESDTTSMRDFITNGFEIGAVRIVPSKLVLATFSFLLLLALARWLRRQLGERWLTRTSLDSGARQSIVSLTSYTIIGVAIMLALSMAGLEFQNLAIVAGALSVGIGFGLQNIVNNFVSGLILLFERPVRPGDWVVVGATEGYVRKISIRYTLIQTFDRADVLVPNSELISNQVTNLMLSDSFGRVNVPVGVAYGTDTRQVREILNKVAREHPMAVLHDPRVAAPKVLFMGFGESSLDFEVRFFISEVDYKMSVRSDILFAIDDAFREANIEIPFPQRVIHKAAQSDAGGGNNEGES